MTRRAEWRPSRGDIATALMVGVFGAFDSLTSEQNNLLEQRNLLAAAVAFLGAFALVFRRRWPFAVAAVSAVVHGLANTPVQLIVSLYSAGLYGGSRRQLAGVSLFALGVYATALTGNTNTNPSGVRALLYAVVYIGGSGLCGAMLRRYNAAVEQRTEALERRREQMVVQARSEERATIAREMHDVVAHRVSLIVVEAGALEVSAGRGTGWTIAVARRIRLSGRTALEELRQIIGVLSPGARETAPLAPHPGLDAIATLVDSFRGVGMDVSLSVEGARRSLPTAAERTAFRLIQESLTNALKHGGGARTRVVLEFRADRLAIRVRNDPPPGLVRDDLPGSGAGLVGIKERIALLGGMFAAQRLSDGGFQVVAVIPLDEISLDYRALLGSA